MVVRHPFTGKRKALTALTEARLDGVVGRRVITSGQRRILDKDAASTGLYSARSFNDTVAVRREDVILVLEEALADLEAEQ